MYLKQCFLYVVMVVKESKTRLQMAPPAMTRMNLIWKSISFPSQSIQITCGIHSIKRVRELTPTGETVLSGESRHLNTYALGKFCTYNMGNIKQMSMSVIG